ncbi:MULTISPECIES: hypothetical protein [Mycolicibacter]|uniref:Uncharacterized protein n=2 Tax=Mycolicibacter TaxID=1073531 RepID=A0ABU5XML7_9MYCO|nr:MULTISPECIES: hypothetical protein [unclassified Mycolicibacter]MEB3023428.1 hypothetical protein [Mycolicibacter sp. MYC098]MEB3033770.1 hypothetical protein [Mycolicibacter sp. MYC340]
MTGGELFYAMPAEFVMPGTSTSDGYDVQAVDVWDGHVALTVHIRRGEVPLHPAARVEPATRVHQRRDLVELCVFADTALDLSRHPQATAVGARPLRFDAPAVFGRFRRQQ